MIKTQLQYQNTKRQIQTFQDALANVRNQQYEEGSDEFLFQQIDVAGLESQLADLRAEAQHAVIRHPGDGDAHPDGRSTQ